jgi:hypothetical protein
MARMRTRGENGSVSGTPSPCAGARRRAGRVVPRRGLNREADGFEQANELVHVLSHPFWRLSSVLASVQRGRDQTEHRVSRQLGRNGLVG